MLSKHSIAGDARGVVHPAQRPVTLSPASMWGDAGGTGARTAHRLGSKGRWWVGSTSARSTAVMTRSSVLSPAKMVNRPNGGTDAVPGQTCARTGVLARGCVHGAASRLCSGDEATLPAIDSGGGSVNVVAPPPPVDGLDPGGEQPDETSRLRFNGSLDSSRMPMEN
jgi:hypothetical protein